MVHQIPCGSAFVLQRDALNQLLEDRFVPSGGAPWSGTTAGTRARPLPLDVSAMPDAVILTAVPGMRPE